MYYIYYLILITQISKIRPSDSFSGVGSSSSSAFALAWRNYSPRSITPPWFYERFCVPLRLGINWGYWPSNSVFDQGGGVHPNLLNVSHLDGVFCLPLA
jgi:hypothetical protein